MTLPSLLPHGEAWTHRVQEATADELEEAYRSEVWNPNRGRVLSQKGLAVQAARVELQTLKNEAKVGYLLQLLSSSLLARGTSIVLTRTSKHKGLVCGAFSMRIGSKGRLLKDGLAGLVCLVCWGARDLSVQR